MHENIRRFDFPYFHESDDGWDAFVKVCTLNGVAPKDHVESLRTIINEKYSDDIDDMVQFVCEERGWSFEENSKWRTNLVKTVDLNGREGKMYATLQSDSYGDFWSYGIDFDYDSEATVLMCTHRDLSNLVQVNRNEGVCVDRKTYEAISKAMDSLKEDIEYLIPDSKSYVDKYNIEDLDWGTYFGWLSVEEAKSCTVIKTIKTDFPKVFKNIPHTRDWRFGNGEVRLIPAQCDECTELGKHDLWQIQLCEDSLEGCELFAKVKKFADTWEQMFA